MVLSPVPQSRSVHCGTAALCALGSEENNSEIDTHAAQLNYEMRCALALHRQHQKEAETTREEDHCVPMAASVASSRLPLLQREKPQTLVALSMTAPPWWEGRRRHQQEVLVWR